MKIIAGLGNPGKEYALTRHNVGHIFIDTLAKELGVRMRRRGLIKYGRGRIGDEEVILIKPLTFMNESGEAIKDFISGHGFDLRDLIVIYDDLDIEAGRVRIRRGGGSGGHRGMGSIIEAFGREDIKRIRIGIGPKRGDASEFVLSEMGEDRERILKGISLGIEALKCMISEGIDKAMSLYNRA